MYKPTKSFIMGTKLIAKVNNVDIIATSDEQLVAIKPICQALGIDHKSQWQKIKDDEDLSSAGMLYATTGADGKQYEMYCLPIRYIFGWLFSINPKNVKPEARQSVRTYRKACYNALYDYFFKQPMKQLEQNQIEISLLEQLSEYSQQKETLNKSITDIKRKLEKLREERLKPDPALF
jgi:uncharacterized tellurite resistance protein B-like protein